MLTLLKCLFYCVYIMLKMSNNRELVIFTFIEETSYKRQYFHFIMSKAKQSSVFE